ncbi:hypothetical protein BJV82DRAFT_584377 [Fennellomyces sp. T-0311]|nr:hypothetical protein BJV82DRAFT_584377 [Fennellomyces sp. T-0311]
MEQGKNFGENRDRDKVGYVVTPRLDDDREEPSSSNLVSKGELSNQEHKSSAQSAKKGEVGKKRKKRSKEHREKNGKERSEAKNARKKRKESIKKLSANNKRYQLELSGLWNIGRSSGDERN